MFTAATAPAGGGRGQERMNYEDLSENERFLTYDAPDGGELVFIGRCPHCGRYVKADGAHGLEDAILADVLRLEDAQEGRGDE